MTGYDYATRIVHGCYPFPYIDIMEYSEPLPIVSHCLPYRDFSVEYPPLALVFITIPRLIASYFYQYVQVYAVEVFLFDLVAMFLLISLSRKLGHDSPWGILGFYTVAILAVGPLLVTRFDFIPAILTLISIFFFIERRNKTAWAFLAAATLTKIYPIVIVPLFFLIQLYRKQKKDLLGGLASFVITCAIITIPFVILSPGGLWESFSYHGQRPLQIESTYASILQLLSIFKLFTINISTSYGSANLTGLVPDVLAKVSFGITALGLLLVYWSASRRLKQSQMDERNCSLVSGEVAFIIKYSLIATLVFILTCKVFSPQYIIWLLPFTPLITQKLKYLIWLLFVAAGTMTFFIFPEYYDSLRNGSVAVILLLIARNVAVFGLLLLLIRSPFLKTKFAERLQDRTAQ